MGIQCGGGEREVEEGGSRKRRGRTASRACEVVSHCYTTEGEARYQFALRLLSAQKLHTLSTCLPNRAADPSCASHIAQVARPPLRNSYM